MSTFTQEKGLEKMSCDNSPWLQFNRHRNSSSWPSWNEVITAKSELVSNQYQWPLTWMCEGHRRRVCMCVCVKEREKASVHVCGCMCEHFREKKRYCTFEWEGGWNIHCEFLKRPRAREYRHKDNTFTLRKVLKMSETRQIWCWWKKTGRLEDRRAHICHSSSDIFQVIEYNCEHIPPHYEIDKELHLVKLENLL